MTWQNEAREAVFRAAHDANPEAVPEYRIPIQKPWWAFWRNQEWETVRGVSRSQMARVQEAMQESWSRRMRRAESMNLPPWFNLNSPLLDEPTP